MILKGRGIKARLQRSGVLFVKRTLPGGVLHDTPSRLVDFHNELKSGVDWGAMIPVRSGQWRTELPPQIFNHPVSSRFTRYLNREIPDAWIAELPQGKVYGRDTNLIINRDNVLSTDLSREFGAYGGRHIRSSELYASQLYYGKSISLPGTTAVITTKGNANFHHWNYDCLPRFQMLREAGLLDKVDHFLIRNQGSPFQRESLQLLGIQEDKIFNTGDKDMLIETDTLLVPSLPSPLGTVSPWVTDFLNDLYHSDGGKEEGYDRIYISRKNASSRQIINNPAFMELLARFGIREVFPEDHSVSAFARIMAGASFIISVHGSGLSNLCFIGSRTVVVDILMPYHQDAYYWQMTNIRGGRYIGFFGNGPHPPDDLDLVAHKIDEDIELDRVALEELLYKELKQA